MTDIEKEMYTSILQPEVNGAKDAASACYEIHKREMDKLKQELMEGAKLVSNVYQDKFKRMLEILMETPPTFNEAVEKFKGE